MPTYPPTTSPETPSQNKKRQLIRFVLLCLIFLISGIFLPLVHRFMTDSSFFSIQKIELVPPGEHVLQEEMQRYLSPFLGRSLYNVDLDEVKSKAKQHPWIKTVAIRRFPPHELHINFSEHRPLALIALHQLYLVDDEGELFKLPTNNPALKLPVITGITKQQFLRNRDLTKAQIKNAIHALNEHALAQFPGGRISELNVRQNMRITAHFADGLEVVLGKGEYAKKWEKLARILSMLSKNQFNLEFAYLDDYPNTHQVAVRLKKVST